jgi:phage terminase large subunit-like protein
MSETQFSAHWLACQPLEVQRAAVQCLSLPQLLNLQSKCDEWRQWARDEQKPPPGDWRTWLYLAGRGAGKTRSGAEWVHEQVGAGHHWRTLSSAAAAAVAAEVGGLT